MPQDKEEICLQLVGDIYDSVMDIHHWQVFLANLTAALDGHAAVFRLFDASTCQLNFVAKTGFSEEYVKVYHDYYHQVDPIKPFADKMPPGAAISSRRIIGDKELLKTEALNDFLRPYGNSFYMLGCNIVNDEQRVARLGIHRPQASQPFDEWEERLLTQLTPHMQRAFSMSQHFISLQQQNDVANTTLDRLPVGVIMLDEKARPLAINQQANALLEQGMGLRADSVKLTTCRHNQARAFEKLLSNAIQKGLGGALCLEGNSQGKRLSAVAAPLNRDHAACFLDVPQACIVLFISPPERQHDFSLEIISSLYGLSRAEARLAAALANGQSLEMFSERNFVSKHTTRAHLRSIFRKADVHTQTDLVRLILNGGAAFACQTGSLSE